MVGMVGGAGEATHTHTHAGRSLQKMQCVHLGHDVLQLAAGLVGAVVVTEAVQHLLVLELVLVGDWENKTSEYEERGGRQNTTKQTTRPPPSVFLLEPSKETLNKTFTNNKSTGFPPLCLVIYSRSCLVKLR